MHLPSHGGKPSPGGASLTSLACVLLLHALTLALAPGAATAQGPSELRVTFIHTSDEHSVLLPVPLTDHVPGEAGPALGGMARLAGAVDSLRREREARAEPVLVTSAGDLLGGTPFAWLLLDGLAPELELMQRIGYDVVTLGNHEFDYGSERLAAYLEAAGHPASGERTALVASNTRVPAGHPLEEAGLRRTHLVTLPNGLRVGFLGLLGAGAGRFATEAAPVTFDPPLEAASRAVAELRSAGAQLVVAVTHSGLDEDLELAREVPGIDVILGGHDHLLFEEPVTEAGTLIVHPGAHLHGVFVLEVGYDPETGAVRARNGETGSPWVVTLDHSVPEDPAVAERVAGYVDRLESRLRDWSHGRFRSLQQTVARSDFTLRSKPPMQETNLGNFITDAMRLAAAAALGVEVDFAFQANGMIRSDVAGSRVADRAGEITVHDLAGAVGLGADPAGEPGFPLVAVWLTGEEVRRVMEVSVLLSELLRDSYYLQPAGLRARYDRSRAILFRVPFRGTPIPTGRSLLSLEREVEGSWVPMEPGDGALYHVVTDRYVASFLPMVGELVPRMAIVPKHPDGERITDLDDAIVRRDGRALTVWQAVLEYAAAQPPDPDGVPRLAAAYAEPRGRLEADRGGRLWVGPAVALLALLAVVALALGLALRRRRRHGSAPD